MLTAQRKIKKPALPSLTSSPKLAKSVAVLILLGTAAALTACGGGDTSSTGCSTTTATDANGAPISTISCS